MDQGDRETTQALVQGIIERLSLFTKDNLLKVLANMALDDAYAFEFIRNVSERNPAERTLQITGLNSRTTSHTLTEVYGLYGEIEECDVIMDGDLNTCNGNAFITYKHKSSALKALKYPSNIVDGGTTECRLAPADFEAVGTQSPPNISKGKEISPVLGRTIYVPQNFPIDLSKIIAYFSIFGDIESYSESFLHGELIFVLTYKTIEDTNNALRNALHVIDEFTLWAVRVEEEELRCINFGPIFPASTLMAQDQTPAMTDSEKIMQGAMLLFSLGKAAKPVPHSSHCPLPSPSSNLQQNPSSNGILNFDHAMYLNQHPSFLEVQREPNPVSNKKDTSKGT